MDMNHYIDEIIKHNKNNLQVIITPTYFYVEYLHGEHHQYKMLVHSNKNYIRIEGFIEGGITYKEEYDYVKILDEFINLGEARVFTYPDDSDGTSEVKNSIIRDRRNSVIDSLL